MKKTKQNQKFVINAKKELKHIEHIIMPRIC